jgi:hypothetical protein
MRTTTSDDLEKEEPVKGCLLLCGTITLLILGVWKLIELVILGVRHFSH